MSSGRGWSRHVAGWGTPPSSSAGTRRARFKASPRRWPPVRARAFSSWASPSASPAPAARRRDNVPGGEHDRITSIRRHPAERGRGAALVSCAVVRPGDCERGTRRPDAQPLGPQEPVLSLRGGVAAGPRGSGGSDDDRAARGGRRRGRDRAAASRQAPRRHSARGAAYACRAAPPAGGGPPPLSAPPARVEEKKIVLDETVAEVAPEPVTPIESEPADVAPSESVGGPAAVSEMVSNTSVAPSPHAPPKAPHRL